MPVPAIANHIYKHIRMKLATKARSDLGTFYYGFRVITVHMQYRRLYHCCQRSTIVGASRIIEVGRETNLVINDEMNRTAGIIAFELTHLHRFIYNTLPGQRGVAVNQYG